MSSLIVAPAVLAHLEPLEGLVLPLHLSGERGRNRAQGLPQVAANDDRSAVLAWLARYKDSPATLASYSKEAERLLLWCVHQHGKALSDLTHEDFLAYESFLEDPQPVGLWVMQVAQKAPRSSPNWRPFAKPLDRQSQRQALSILNSLFNWLVQAGYLAGNPLALRRRKAVARPANTSRFLPHEHWAHVRATIESLPTTTPRLALQAARYRWLFSLLYIGGLRISEVCNNSMGDFYWRKGADGRERWWLEVRGKGEKTRVIPATDELVAELMRYRKANNLSPLPREGDALALLLPLIGGARSMGRSGVHELVKDIFRETAARLRALGPDHEAAAAHVEQASAHWMRHTAGTHQSSSMDLKAVRDNLGHSNIATTSVYLHTEDDARHDQTSSAHRIGWSSL
ncbi:tyrosine-type recombinase/integrase [Acidovorax sp. NCPPB 4044]|uniref:tyrosine-type recombinase/integrase n=1 Tax=Acidovorax sp. NCPPB 4044 TaxID=2940490 RepID=UPI001A936750|nr:site-specific integrase [Acidovorax sp. NCPPB 4044]MDA8521002.1 tyrosine-type recombinase/integrase [Acidovorax sp. NCPPB 4044]